jgi:hypothetical protein
LKIGADFSSLRNPGSRKFKLILHLMSWRSGRSEWVNYYSECAHVPKILDDKIKQVSDYLDIFSPEVVYDLGANTGVFSRIASDRGINTVSMDIDPGCREGIFPDYTQKAFESEFTQFFEIVKSKKVGDSESYSLPHEK